MARKIIVLDQVGLPSDSIYNVAFWLLVPTARQPFHANATATSRVVGIQAAELSAIQAGQVVEVVEAVPYVIGTPLSTIQADLIARYNIAQTAVNNQNP